MATPTGQSEKVVFVFIQAVRLGVSAQSEVGSINITQFDLRNGRCVILETCMLEMEQQLRKKKSEILRRVLKERRPSFNLCTSSPLSLTF